MAGACDQPDPDRRRRAQGVDDDQRRAPVEPVHEAAQRDAEEQRRQQARGERGADGEARVRDLERDPADRDEADRPAEAPAPPASHRPIAGDPECGQRGTRREERERAAGARSSGHVTLPCPVGDRRPSVQRQFCRSRSGHHLIVPPSMGRTTLANHLAEAVAGRPPAPDGGVSVVPAPAGARAAIVAFTAHHVVAADVDPAWIAEHCPPWALEAPSAPRSSRPCSSGSVVGSAPSTSYSPRRDCRSPTPHWACVRRPMRRRSHSRRPESAPRQRCLADGRRRRAGDRRPRRRRALGGSDRRHS